MSELILNPAMAPIPEVIEALERALERARAGEVRGIGLAFVLADRAVATEIEMGDGGACGLYYAAGILHDRCLNWGTT